MEYEFCIRSGAVGPTSREVQEQAFRSMKLLDAIEGTVTRLVSDTEIIRTLVREFSGFREYLRSKEPVGLLDPEGRARAMFERAAEVALRIYNDSIAGREGARRDKALTGEDGVEDAFTSFIEAIADLHNLCEDISDTMATLDAERSPVIGSANTPEDLFRMLKG